MKSILILIAIITLVGACGGPPPAPPEDLSKHHGTWQVDSITEDGKPVDAGQYSGALIRFQNGKIGFKPAGVNTWSEAAYTLEGRKIIEEGNSTTMTIQSVNDTTLVILMQTTNQPSYSMTFTRVTISTENEFPDDLSL